MKRILVVRGGAIGDFVLTLPGLKLLREQFPSAQLEIIGYKHIVALAENRFYADAVRSIEYAGLATFFARDAELPTDLADYFHSFDLVVSYLFDPDRLFERNVARCGVDNFIACNPKISGDEHAALQLARPLRQLGLSLRNPAAEIYPNNADREFAADFTGSFSVPIVALHPGSGSARKNWPLEKWRALAIRLLQSKRAQRLLIVGGEADRQQLAIFKNVFASAEIGLADNIPLPDLAAVLERCALFIGHDSGISHIAAAVNTRCLLLFGTTDPMVWAPANRNVRVLRSAPRELTDLSVDEVFAASCAAPMAEITS